MRFSSRGRRYFALFHHQHNAEGHSHQDQSDQGFVGNQAEPFFEVHAYRTACGVKEGTVREVVQDGGTRICHRCCPDGIDPSR